MSQLGRNLKSNAMQALEALSPLIISAHDNKSGDYELYKETFVKIGKTLSPSEASQGITYAEQAITCLRAKDYASAVKYFELDCASQAPDSETPTPARPAAEASPARPAVEAPPARPAVEAPPASKTPALVESIPPPNPPADPAPILKVTMKRKDHPEEDEPCKNPSTAPTRPAPLAARPGRGGKKHKNVHSSTPVTNAEGASVDYTNQTYNSMWN